MKPLIKELQIVAKELQYRIEGDNQKLIKDVKSLIKKLTKYFDHIYKNEDHDKLFDIIKMLSSDAPHAINEFRYKCEDKDIKKLLEDTTDLLTSMHDAFYAGDAVDYNVVKTASNNLTKMLTILMKKYVDGNMIFLYKKLLTNLLKR